MAVYVGGEEVGTVIVEKNTKLQETLNKTITNLTAQDLEGVTQIPNYAFQNCIDLTSVEFPSILQTIGYEAFRDCDSLTLIDFGDNSQLTSIGDYAFRTCRGLTGTLDLSNCTNLTSIGISAFHDCSGLTNITLPSSLETIGTSAFYGCSGLTGTLDLSNCTNLTSIGSSAFRTCRGLTSITLPSSSTSIGSKAFQNCTSLTTMRVEATTPPTLSNTDAISIATTRIEVPMASVDAYKAATNWSNFADIIVGYAE